MEPVTELGFRRHGVGKAATERAGEEAGEEKAEERRCRQVEKTTPGSRGPGQDLQPRHH